MQPSLCRKAAWWNGCFQKEIYSIGKVSEWSVTECGEENVRSSRVGSRPKACRDSKRLEMEHGVPHEWWRPWDTQSRLCVNWGGIAVWAWACNRSPRPYPLLRYLGLNDPPGHLMTALGKAGIGVCKAK